MAKTREEFMDVMDGAEGCYVYFVDKNGRMHFLAEEGHFSSAFCDSLADAFMCTENEANALQFLCMAMYPKNTYHIVKLHTNVEWL